MKTCELISKKRSSDKPSLRKLSQTAAENSNLFLPKFNTPVFIVTIAAVTKQLLQGTANIVHRWNTHTVEPKRVKTAQNSQRSKDSVAVLLTLNCTVTGVGVGCSPFVALKHATC
jgi:hypothetical protein